MQSMISLNKVRPFYRPDTKCEVIKLLNGALNLFLNASSAIKPFSLYSQSESRSAINQLVFINPLYTSLYIEIAWTNSHRYISHLLTCLKSCHFDPVPKPYATIVLSTYIHLNSVNPVTLSNSTSQIRLIYIRTLS